MLSDDAQTTAGILLLTLVAVEYGGYAVLRIVRRQDERTEFQEKFARAGHAHAGVLVVLALVGQVLVDDADLDGAPGWLARNCIWIAAVLMSGGFFLSSAHRGATGPNRFILLMYAGAVSLAAGVISLGIGLLT